MESLSDAQRILDIVRAGETQEKTEELLAPLSRAFHRKAQAQAALGDPISAIRTYREAFITCPHRSKSLAAAARLLLDVVDISWLALYWTTAIETAQKPHPLSSRDGLLLKPVPAHYRLSSSQLRLDLTAFLHEGDHASHAKDLMMSMWIDGRKPGRAEVSFYRSAAYLRAGIGEQAQRDAWGALVYGPQGAAGDSTWGEALLLHANALESLGENVQALQDASRAAALCPESADAASAVERLLRRVPEHYAEAVRCRGPDGLIDVLKAEKDHSLPPFLKPRPKYYYYFQWMKRRISARHPELPDAIMDKLLTLDATELDLLLQYPEAIDSTVETLQDILHQQGEAILSTSAVPLLSWERTQELQAKAEIIGRITESGPAAMIEGNLERNEMRQTDNQAGNIDYKTVSVNKPALPDNDASNASFRLD